MSVSSVRRKLAMNADMYRMEGNIAMFQDCVRRLQSLNSYYRTYGL